MHYLIHLAELATPDIHPGGECATRQLIEALALSANQRILELGCGTGNTALRLARRDDIRIVALDFMNEMLMAARRRVKSVAANCALIRADACSLPFRDRTFDRVYAESSLGIQSRSGIKNALAEAFRVLRPGGIFVANEAIWKPKIDQATVTAVNRLAEQDFGLRPAPEDAWSEDEWLREICDAGFDVVSWRSISARGCSNRPGILVAKCLRRLRTISSPARWRTDRAYRKLIDRHRTIGSLIEARLFVALKPD